MNHLRPLLVPQRNLRRDLLVLINPRHDLPRAVDNFLFGKLKHLELTVVLLIGSGDHPCRQIVFARRCERQHLDELGVRLAGNPHDRVVGQHLLRITLGVDGGDLPLIFFVVEHDRIRHVVGRVHGGLQAENGFWISEVPPQVGRHRIDGFQQARINLRQRQCQRVAWIGEVVIGRAVVRVDDHLYGIADVVQAVGRGRRVGIVVAHRIGIANPEQAAVRDDHVRVFVVSQKRCDRRQPVGDVAMVENPALGGNVVAEENLQRLKPDAEQDLSSEAADHDAVFARIGGLDVLIALGIVKFLRLGVDEHIVVRQLAEVDARLGDLNFRDRRLRRNILHEQHRQAFLRDFVDRAERQSVAVREREMFVDPVTVRKTF